MRERLATKAADEEYMDLPHQYPELVEAERKLLVECAVHGEDIDIEEWWRIFPDCGDDGTVLDPMTGGMSQENWLALYKSD